ncbi:unnamed protein product [Phytophthora fragariaefolia]|uniref:Unnamed protein product n=1 Tax=Phytophthora fragariaefolia TaxID=1490495 RepID=A0A9W7D5S9_9STRA|nr:unnamed protein product [Phytophthora fragariaefolia]
MYNDVFTSARAESTPDSAVGSSKKRRRNRRSSRRAKRRRRRGGGQEDEEDEDEQEDDDDDDEHDEADHFQGDLSMREINRRIKEQQELEKREQEKHSRASRYSLRSRESLTNSEASAVSPPQVNTRTRASAKRSQLEVVDAEDGHVEELEGEADNESQSENEANLDDEHEDENDEGGPASSTRYQLRHRRQETLSSTMATRSRTKSSSTPVLENENTSRRYSLRDRSKANHADTEEDAAPSPETSAYTEYHKRQASRASRRSSANGSSSSRRLFLSEVDSSPPPRRRRNRNKHGRGHRNHRCRSLSSSSSSGSSSSSEVFMDDDDSDGGMRTSSPWRSSKGGRRSGSSRADITPVEVDRSITWESVGGLKSHIEALKEMVMLPLLYPEFYDKYKVSPPSGVLFYGPPGTGKTLLARALANSCSVYGEGEQGSDSKGLANLAQKTTTQGRPRRQVTFYMRKGADCLSKWVGEAERQLRLLFEEAKRNQPSIIFFDEIDGLAPVRSAKQDQIHASIVSTLLALMDGMDSRGRVVVIGATNRLDAIDPALRRPGRFDRELGFKLPSVHERKSMLAIHSKHWKPSLSDRFLTHLAEQTVGYCGADIKALCAEAALCSLRRVYPQVYASQDKLLINLDKVVVSRSDFVKAAKKITPASHRAVSSFASPLPRSVKGLLQAELKNVLRDVAHHFPLFPLDKAAIDDAVTSGDNVENDASVNEDEDDDDDIYAVVKHDDCDVCHGNEGELLRCAACPCAFHDSCLSDTTTCQEPADKHVDGLWFCPECRSSNAAAVQNPVNRSHVNSIASLHLPRHSGFPRVLVAGKAGMGQQHIGPALLHLLEGLTHFSLDYPSLVADSNSHFPEEALIQRLTEAQKCLPCVLYLPQIELWWKNTTESMHLTLKMMLMNLQVRANLPILFLACTASSSCDEQKLPEDLLALFQEDYSVSETSVIVELDAPSKVARLAHFEQIFNSLATPPSVLKTKRTRNEKLEVLPLAPLPAAPSFIDLSPEEQQKRKERDLHFLRELRIFLSQVLDYCYSQRLYTPFYVPVDPAAVPNYYLIVKRPMDLSTMRDKLNDEEYTCFEQFMDDIQLIVRNANVFNPKRSRTRHIAHAAGTMKDNILSYAHRFRIRQGYDLFAKCREVTKRLRAHPSIYGEYGERFLKSSGKSTRKHHARAPEKPGVRTSARLRGVKAPEISLDAAISRATASGSSSRKVISNGVTVKKEPTEKVLPQSSSKKEVAESDTQGSSLQVTQWFGDDEEEEEKQSEDEHTNTDTDEKTDDKTTESVNDDEDEFDEGDRVFVSSRTHPGVNRPGGAGVVLGRNKDGTYNVKYILGGSEKDVSVKYIKRLTDDAVMESVKTQRSGSSSTDAPGSVRLIQDEEKMDETDYFDELLWPLLKDEGWTRDDNFDIIEASGKESGLAVQRVVFTPGKPRTGETVTLNSVMEALKYINEDPELAKKCFGTRYAESMMTDQALGGDSSDEETGEEEEASVPRSGVADGPAPAAPSEGTDEPMAEARDEEAAEDVQEDTPDFIYDEVRSNAGGLDQAGVEDGGLVGGQAARRAAAAEQAGVPVPREFRPDRPDAGACVESPALVRHDCTRSNYCNCVLLDGSAGDRGACDDAVGTIRPTLLEKTVLAEYTATSGNFPTVTRVLLAKIPAADGRMSYVYDRHIFHYIVEGGVTFLCMADDDLKRRVPFLFLEDMKSRFQAAYGARARTAIAFAMNEPFQHEIRRLLEHYNTHPDADSLARVQRQIDDVKDVMVENIDKVLDRGEKFELLVDRTDKLSRQAVKFERSSTQLRRSMWRRNLKLWLLLVLVGLLLVYLVVSMACGFDLSGCSGKRDE